MKELDVASGVTPLTLIKAQSATSTVTGTGVDVSTLDGVLAVTLNAAQASAGTSPTLDVTVETSAVIGSGYTAVSGVTFTRVTDASGTITEIASLAKDKCKQYVRAIGTIGGTNTPTFQFSVVLSGRKNRV